jgi:hypothetical protein
VLGNRTIGGEALLAVLGRLEPWHALFPLLRRVARILRAGVEIAVLPMFHPGQDLAHGAP